ncbi:uncharacterized protein [Spinacia oleracea]|uniref:Reverse transcriptase zinc-binding domain-containing protein n=1 Tax=Spinacia oleracea TaxID=3562 RepID=A0ABM3RS86_SPIOL|nr:uncharacterized protein LOC130472074 [Spinacia oleracea]
MHGEWTFSPDQVPAAFLEYYKCLLGTKLEARTSVKDQIVHNGPLVTAVMSSGLNAPFTKEEIKSALWDIDGGKAPGPDGFGSSFSKVFGVTLGKMLRVVLPDLIAQNQGAFDHSRFIAHNIMVCQDLVKGYERKNSSASCLIKMDVQKAYDTVEWDFVEEMMAALKFPAHFIKLIMQCVKSPRFSLNFEGGGGKKDFKYHPRCKGSKLNHLCFADDLILCCKGFFKFVYLMMQGFKLFPVTTGLQGSPSKTFVYYTGMSESNIHRILDMTGFSKGRFPFRYLGLPICSNKIIVGECEKIVENMCARIKIRSSRNMSFAGRLTLVNSVLMTLQTYWSRIMVLPKGVYNTINTICRNFLWKGTADATGPGKVAWGSICKSKKEGGLGLTNLKLWNIAAMGNHVWMVATKKDNMWVRWVNTVYIKDGNWWDYTPKVGDNWYWRAIGTVKEWMKRYLTEVQLSSMPKYAIKEAYCCLAPVVCKVPWTNAVWDKLSIPKHRFISWLAMLERLNTKDILVKMGITADMLCFLCGSAVENHKHLFFECHYSARCWLECSTKDGMQNAPKSLSGLF